MTNRAMSDSNVKWIGDIPNNWSVEPIGKLFTERNTKVSDLDFPPLSVTKKGIVPQLENAAKSKNHNDRKQVNSGDFVINSRSDRKMSSGLSSLDGSVSLINIVLTSKSVFPGYTKYLLKNYGFAEEFYRWGTGIVADLWSTRYERMKRILVPYPSYEEQQKIAAFLDEKVAHIDNIIEDTKKSIENLKAYKQSLITETVTKGLNPDVEMKDSGIDWIGDIPKYWKIYKIGQIFKEHKEKNEGLIEDNLLSLSYGKVKRRDIKSKEGLLPQSFEGYNIIKPGDIVLRMTDLQNDQKSLRVGLCKERGIITSAYISIRAYNNIYPYYAYYYLHSFDIYKGFYGMGAGVRQGVNFNELKKLDILFPTYDEQKQIAIVLDEKSRTIESTIEQKEQLITELEAYKKSLIYEYVTGKKEVK